MIASSSNNTAGRDVTAAFPPACRDYFTPIEGSCVLCICWCVFLCEWLVHWAFLMVSDGTGVCAKQHTSP